MPQPSWSPSTTQQLRKLVAAPYLSPNDWTPRSNAYFASPLALCARRVSSAASRLLGSTSLRFALHGWQRGRLLIALDDFINPKVGRQIFGCETIFDHAAKANQSRYPWAQNIVSVGLLKHIKGRWGCLFLDYRFYLPKK
ncbi:hypothetical protein [Thiolapillus sp.]|uniref:hypothetical protein n=3 Tax=Thiolapillus sp. TaxID=2017437 RepID=UPI003AF43C8A